MYFFYLTCYFVNYLIMRNANNAGDFMEQVGGGGVIGENIAILEYYNK